MARQRRVPGYTNLTMDRDVPATMRDDTVLYADVYRPTTGGPFPVILMRLPYDKTHAGTWTYHYPVWYARHGYTVVVQDVRGRFRSEGTFYPFANEAEDGFDSVEWAAQLSNSNGRVGMYGFSYPGLTQLQAALLRPPGLKAICPGFTSSQYYEGWTYNGGAFALAFAALWATQLVRDEARRQGDSVRTRELTEAFLGAPAWYGYLPLNQYPPLAASDFGSYFFDWLRHSSYDEYWRQWSVDTGYSRIDVPALHVGGWYDIFIRGTITNFTGLRQWAGSREARKAQKLLVGPWYHSPWIPVTGVINFGDAARQPVDEWQLRWFDQFLKDEDTGVLDQPVTVFLMGENRWIEEADWPPRGSEMQEFYLHSDGDANPVNRGGSLSLEAPGSEPPDIFVYDPLAPTPSVGGHSCCIPILTPMGPEDQASVEVLNGVLVYTSPRLEKDLAVMGPVRITLYAATSAVDTDWTAKLCDVSPSGKSINIQEGIIRARFRKSLSEPELLEPYEVYEYSIDLGSTAHVFRAGHRIRLQVSSSDFPQWDRSLNTGGDLGTEGAERAVVAQQFVLHDGEHPSRLSLMVAR